MKSYSSKKTSIITLRLVFASTIDFKHYILFYWKLNFALVARKSSCTFLTKYNENEGPYLKSIIEKKMNGKLLFIGHFGKIKFQRI